MKYITKKEVDVWGRIIVVTIIIFFIALAVVKLYPQIFGTIAFISFLWTWAGFFNFKSIAYLYINQPFDFKTMTERDINDRIDLWHTLDRDTGELGEFLGMTKEEYKEFLEQPIEFYEKYNILEND